MTFAARPHAAAGGPAGLPLGTTILFAESYDEFGTTDTGTITFNTDGTIAWATTFEYGPATVPTNWYGPTTGGIGNSFQVRFTLQSGTAWDAGLTSGTLYALSAARALTWTLSYNEYNTASVLVEIFYSGGSPYKFGTMSVDLYNGDA